jgi:hypothetical protein
MYRTSSGYVPLHNRSYVEDLTVTVSGSALSDLNVYITAPNNEPYKPIPAVCGRQGEVQPFAARFEKNAPGQLILLSWKKSAASESTTARNTAVSDPPEAERALETKATGAGNGPVSDRP